MMSYSFIIPVFNNKIYAIKKCIKSIISQNIEKYEIIVINDGSTDEELNNYCEKELKIIKNLKYFYEKNSGSAVARNLGLKYASCDYIVFVDADDELEKFFFSNIKNINLGNISVFDYSFVNNDTNTLYSFNNTKVNLKDDKNDIYANICFYPGKMNNFMFGSIWGKIFSTKYLKNNEVLFIPRLRKAQDRVFMLYALGKTNDIKYYPILMYKYKLNNESITHKLNFKMNDYYYYLYEEMTKFAIDYELDESITKFLAYNILNELLPLTIFNVNYKKKYSVIRSKLISLIKKYKVDQSINRIKCSEIPTKKGKIKFLLYKYRLYYLIYIIIKNMQRKDNKRLIK